MCRVRLGKVIPCRAEPCRIDASSIQILCWGREIIHTVLTGIGPVARDIAVVVLQIYQPPLRRSQPRGGGKRRLTIYTPARECGGIDALISNTRRISRAGLRPCTAIDPKFQTQGMNLCRQTAHPRRELDQIGDDLLSDVIPTANNRPAIIYVHIFIACVLSKQTSQLVLSTSVKYNITASCLP